MSLLCHHDQHPNFAIYEPAGAAPPAEGPTTIAAVDADRDLDRRTAVIAADTDRRRDGVGVGAVRGTAGGATVGVASSRARGGFSHLFWKLNLAVYLLTYTALCLSVYRCTIS